MSILLRWAEFSSAFSNYILFHDLSQISNFISCKRLQGSCN